MISSAIRKVGPFIGNGSASVFPFTFKVFSKADLVVVQALAGAETTLVVDSDFTAALNADQDGNPGGSITLTAGALAVGYTLIISSNIAETQQTQLTNLGGFFPEVITAALDKLTILAQQLQEQLDRAVTLPITDPSLDTELPSASSRSGKLLGFDSSTGAPVALTPIGDIVTGDMTYARLDGGNTPFVGAISAKTLNGIRFADQFSGASVTAKIDAALADITVGLVIVPSTMGAGSPTSIPSKKAVLDLRSPDVNSNFQLYTNYSTTLPALAVTDAGVIYLIRSAAINQNPLMFGITGEPFERAIVQMDGTAAGRSKSLQFLYGPGTDTRYLSVSPNLVQLYATGTADVTHNSTAVVGHGTTWNADMIGQAFITNADPTRIMVIAAVPSATSITLNTAWGGSTAAGGTYSIQTPVWDSSGGFRMDVNNRFLWGQTSGGAQVQLIGIDNAGTNLYQIANGAIRVNSANGKVGINTSPSTGILELKDVNGGNPLILRNGAGNATHNFNTDGSGNGDLLINDTTGAAQVDLSGTAATKLKLGVNIGQGTDLTKAVVYSQTITPGAVAAATVAEQTFTVTGLTTADKIIVNPAATGNSTAAVSFRVSGANTLAVQFVNPTAGSLTPGAGTWNIIAIRS